MKIGNYTDDEILEFMTEGESRGFLGRSMFDAMYFEIERLNNIINELEKYIDEDKWTSVNGVITAKLIRNKIKELRGSDKE